MKYHPDDFFLIVGLVMAIGCLWFGASQVGTWKAYAAAGFVTFFWIVWIVFDKLWARIEHHQIKKLFQQMESESPEKER